MKQVRNIVVKTLLNADEFSAFEAACKAADDIPHSRALRDMVNGFSGRNDKRRQKRSEWPVSVHNKAMFLPGRVNYGGMKMNMRM